MGAAAAGRMLYPPDVGSEGNEVIDLETRGRRGGRFGHPAGSVSRSIVRPAEERRDDGRRANPVYDKELHSEIFSQGTLDAAAGDPDQHSAGDPDDGRVSCSSSNNTRAWFGVYVIVFNMLVGPSFLAGSITSERERQTLDLLLTTPLSPTQILWGKFVVRFRITLVLTSFLLWPLVLGAALNNSFWSNGLTVCCMFLIVAVVCLVNCVVALTSSMFCRKTSIALLTTYAVLLLSVRHAPGRINARSNAGDVRPRTLHGQTGWAWQVPFRRFSRCRSIEEIAPDNPEVNAGNLPVVLGYFAFSGILVLLATGAMVLRLKSRKGLSDG